MSHLGADIKKVLKQRGMTVSEFARRINKSRENIYHIFGRKSLDTELLQTISLVLRHDFTHGTGVSVKDGPAHTMEPAGAFTRMEKELEFIREELLHMRKEMQYLRELVIRKENTGRRQKK